jgi:hypothetical protein
MTLVAGTSTQHKIDCSILTFRKKPYANRLAGHIAIKKTFGGASIYSLKSIRNSDQRELSRSAGQTTESREQNEGYTIHLLGSDPPKAAYQ